jgi:hypothetical protein
MEGFMPSMSYVQAAQAYAAYLAVFAASSAV